MRDEITPPIGVNLPEPSFSESFGEFRDIQRLRQTRSSRLSFLRNVADFSRDRIGNGVGRVRRTGSKGNDGIEKVSCT